MKYSQFPYQRINLEEFKRDTQVMINNFNSANSADQQIEIINNYQSVQKNYHSYGSIAHLNFAKNTKDEKAVKENKYYNEIGPEIAAIDNLFTKAIDASKFKKELLSEFGEHYFNLISMELKSFDSKLVGLMKE